MTIEELKQRKKELGLSNKELAKRSNVPVGTLQKIFSGETKIPRWETLTALEKALQISSVQFSQYESSEDVMRTAGRIQENTSEYIGGNTAKRDTRKTLQDYLELPETDRVELIDGVFYDMAAPMTIHQALMGLLYKYLMDYVMANKGPCMPFVSPVDVQLDEDDYTVVQPDVLIICDRNKFKSGRVFGAPDFVAEVLSPSTRKKDISLKYYKYVNAGVREYWIIDPVKKCIVVYDIEHEALPALYSFDDKIPVLIWDSKCIIDFAVIDSMVNFLND